jgi:hypothetical protein
MACGPFGRSLASFLRFWAAAARWSSSRPPFGPRSLAAQVRRSGLVFVLTHNYTGYPLVRQARAMARNGTLGDIRLVQVEYAQDWLAGSTEEAGTSRRNGARTRPVPALAAASAISERMPSTLPISAEPGKAARAIDYLRRSCRHSAP